MSNANWWANKLGQQPGQQPGQQQRPTNMPMPPSQQPMTPYAPPQQQMNPVLSKAQSANQTQLCPTCSSSNYMSVAGAKIRCYDCGYPLEQSGSKYGSLTGAKVEGSAKSAKGNDVVNNFNPQQIIGRIDG
jgi:hypothetical protein